MNKLRLCSLLIIVTGCVTDYGYNVVLLNIGKVKLTDATVNYGTFMSGGGNLIPNTRSVYLLPSHPVPAKATVVWRTPDGILHEKEVEVKSRVPKKFEGDIYFKIDDQNNVTVEAIPTGR